LTRIEGKQRGRWLGCGSQRHPRKLRTAQNGKQWGRWHNVRESCLQMPEKLQNFLNCAEAEW